MELKDPETALAILQQKMSKIFEKNETKGEIPSSDQKACDLMGAIELNYQIYLTNEALTRNVIMAMFESLNEQLHEVATERGVVIETQTRTQTASMSN